MQSQTYRFAFQPVAGPSTREPWEGATQLMEACRGLSRRHRLVPFVHKVYVDVRELAASLPGVAAGAYPDPAADARSSSSSRPTA